MSIIILYYLLIILLSFYFLIKSADYLISSSSIIGERVGISKFIIGLTLIAIGTSLPELFTAIFGVIDFPKNSASFVFGTVIGSNIANTLLVFSILLLFSKNFKVKIKIFDLLFLLFITFSLLILMYLGKINIYISLIYLFLFIFYLYISIKYGSKSKFEEEVEELEEENMKKLSNFKLILIFLTSLIALNFSAKTVVYGIYNFGVISEIPISFLTFTTVAFATSLPELFVTYNSAKKREFSLAIGNIIGSNVSNILFILGSIGLFSNLSFNYKNYIISIYFLIFITIIFIIIILFKKLKKQLFIGLTLLLLYLSYIIYMF